MKKNLYLIMIIFLLKNSFVLSEQLKKTDNLPNNKSLNKFENIKKINNNKNNQKINKNNSGQPVGQNNNIAIKKINPESKIEDSINKNPIINGETQEKTIDEKNNQKFDYSNVFNIIKNDILYDIKKLEEDIIKYQATYKKKFNDKTIQLKDELLNLDKEFNLLNNEKEDFFKKYQLLSNKFNDTSVIIQEKKDEYKRTQEQLAHQLNEQSTMVGDQYNTNLINHLKLKIQYNNDTWGYEEHKLKVEINNYKKKISQLQLLINQINQKQELINSIKTKKNIELNEYIEIKNEKIKKIITENQLLIKKKKELLLLMPKD